MSDALQWFDLLLSFDPATRRVDLVLGEDGDLTLDLTPATPMVISLGTDRRARPDDELPSGLAETNRPTTLIARRGWAGDALDAGGARIGSRLWLLDRAKSSDLTRLMGEEWAKEAFTWVEDETGTAAAIEVAWLRRDVLGVQVTVDGRTVSMPRSI